MRYIYIVHIQLESDIIQPSHLKRRKYLTYPLISYTHLHSHTDNPPTPTPQHIATHTHTHSPPLLNRIQDTQTPSPTSNQTPWYTHPHSRFYPHADKSLTLAISAAL